MYAHALPGARDTETNTLGTPVAQGPSPAMETCPSHGRAGLSCCVRLNHYKEKALSSQCPRAPGSHTEESEEPFSEPRGGLMSRGIYCARAGGRAGATSTQVSQGCGTTESELSSEL